MAQEYTDKELSGKLEPSIKGHLFFDETEEQWEERGGFPINDAGSS